MKLFLHSIGCRLNQSEMDSLARRAVAAGHDVVSDVAVADQIVVNTCAVTAEAARDARRFTGRAHRRNEAADILLTGCYATIAPDELTVLPGATAVIPNAQKETLLQLIDPDAPLFDREPLLRTPTPGTIGPTRAFVKVQDGCDNRCTFCVTTLARGDGRSRPLGDVVAEVQGLAAAGYREAVLSGVHLGSYGRDLGHQDGLYKLVAALLQHTDMPRLRLSSLEPWDITPGFFDLWANPRLLPHLHLPLQAGSDATLRRMARRTTRAAYRALVADARAAIPDLNLSSDIIVGFPGESDTDFKASLDFVREIAFARLHVFGYSSRPGTAAANMPGHLPSAVKKARTRRLIALGHELSAAFHRRYVGRSVNVLWESPTGADDAGLRWRGYSDNYIRVTAPGPADLANRVTAVHLTAADAHGATGTLQQTV